MQSPSRLLALSICPVTHRCPAIILQSEHLRCSSEEGEAGASKSASLWALAVACSHLQPLNSRLSRLVAFWWPYGSQSTIRFENK